MSSQLDVAAEIIQARVGLEPLQVAIILNAGLAESIEGLQNEIVIPYSDLPGFPKAQAFGQENRLIIGELEGVRIACLKGCSHFFESGDAVGMAVPLEIMTLLGVQTLLITATCGSVDADLYPGALAVVVDHINLTGVNPLFGGSNEGGTISLTKAYDERLALRMKRAALSGGLSLRDGVFMLFSGPSFETPAEIRMARTLGANMVGMSGVHEVILARRLGMRVCFVAATTYFGAGFNKSDPTSIETRVVARQATISLKRLIRSFLRTKEGSNYAAEDKPSILRKQLFT